MFIGQRFVTAGKLGLNRAVVSHEVQRAKFALARAQAGRTPDVDVEAAVRYKDATENTTATIGIGVPLQIFDRNQGNISRAYASFGSVLSESKVCC